LRHPGATPHHFADLVNQFGANLLQLYHAIMARRCLISVQTLPCRRASLPAGGLESLPLTAGTVVLPAGAGLAAGFAGNTSASALRCATNWASACSQCSWDFPSGLPSVSINAVRAGGDFLMGGLLISLDILSP